MTGKTANDKFFNIALLRFLPRKDGIRNDRGWMIGFLPRQVGVRNDKEYCMLGLITLERWGFEMTEYFMLGFITAKRWGSK